MWSRGLGQMSPKLCSLLVNMISVSCILSLGLFCSALCRDFSGDEMKSEISKRNAGLNEQTCTSFPGVESTLQNSSHTVSDTFSFFFRFNSLKKSNKVSKCLCAAHGAATCYTVNNLQNLLTSNPHTLKPLTAFNTRF